jgi:uncharacterized protein (DUF433 family)
MSFVPLRQCKRMKQFARITLNPEVMGGKPCIRGMRMTVGTIVGLVATGYTTDRILQLYPYLEADDIKEALAFAAWRVEEIEVSLARAA